jgi:twitching motility protein PilU
MQEKFLDIAPYLAYMVKNGGADMFLHTGAKILFKGPIGFRWMGEKLPPGETERVLRSVTTDEKLKEFEEHGEVDFALGLTSVGRFRANAFRQRGEVSIVFRHVKNDIPSIEQLRVPLILKDMVMKKNGLVLIVGSTGSGKSTTLAAMIDHRNSNAPGHILTLEDPIEYIHTHKKSVVAQREIGVDTESYHTGMRSAMREAPDVVLMGEVRDTESMDFGLKLANTGHLCLSTLHANNTVSALDRILNFFPRETQDQEIKRIAENLRAIVCQRLVPSKDKKKAAAVEVMVNTPRITDLILKQDFSSIRNAMEHGANYKMQTFDQALIKLYEANIITPETAMEFADSRNNVGLHIRIGKGNIEADGEFSLEEITDEHPGSTGTGGTVAQA